MSETTGRAGFHARHVKSAGDRAAILHEAMRELDPAATTYWAARNPSIVVADEVLNEAFVNDSDGGFRACTSASEVVEYGAARLGRLSRKLRKDAVNPKTGRPEGGTITTSLVVSHLPKSMCVEVPDFYPVLNADGEPVLGPDGAPLRRSRWVARDREEARRYFEDIRDFLCEHVVSGGSAALLGYDIQHSETTPHIQLIFDAFEDDPKKDGKLRASASRDWFSHRDVRGEDGKMIQGPEKMRRYHAELKDCLIAKGYDISPDFDEERHEVGLAKPGYVAIKAREAEVEAMATEVLKVGDLYEAARDALRTAGQALVDEAEADREAAAEELAQAKRVRAAAYDAGRKDGRAAGYAAGRAEALTTLTADRDMLQRARAKLAEATAAYEEALDGVPTITDVLERIRGELRHGDAPRAAAAYARATSRTAGHEAEAVARDARTAARAALDARDDAPQQLDDADNSL